MPVYTLFGQTPAPPLVVDATSYTLGVQFSVSRAGTMPAIWFYSPSGAAALPSKIKLFAVSGQVLLTDQAASWSGAAGSGWVRAPFSTPPNLAASTNYKACVFEPSAVSWRAGTANYWSSGAGSAGISSGPLSAPNNAGGDGGQDTFLTGEGYPNSSFNATNYWVDLEASVAAVAGLQQQQSGRSMLRKRLMYADV